ncbi:MAG: DNA-directed RNA polymerase subunit H [Candidatus Aenigmarchaeota archaeon]|nr:DNA-directed RNA polymerase subunit H [Candidatus Aenigmarchaeota archaeon]
MATPQKFNITTHELVPKHVILTEKEKKALLEKYNISVNELPKILVTDPIVKDIKAKTGDVIKITRKSHTAGESVYYRGVVNA